MAAFPAQLDATTTNSVDVIDSCVDGRDIALNFNHECGKHAPDKTSTAGLGEKSKGATILETFDVLTRLIESHFWFPLGLPQWDRQLSSYHDFHLSGSLLPAFVVRSGVSRNGRRRQGGVTRMMLRLVAHQW